MAGSVAWVVPGFVLFQQATFPGTFWKLRFNLHETINIANLNWAMSIYIYTRFGKARIYIHNPSLAKILQKTNGRTAQLT